jgi:hypothetical protein
VLTKRTHKEDPMYQPTRHPQLGTLYPVGEPISAPARPGRALSFATLLKALRWIGEIRVLMPFSNPEGGPWRDNRPDWYY